MSLASSQTLLRSVMSLHTLGTFSVTFCSWKFLGSKHYLETVLLLGDCMHSTGRSVLCHYPEQKWTFQTYIAIDTGHPTTFIYISPKPCTECEYCQVHIIIIWLNRNELHSIYWIYLKITDVNSWLNLTWADNTEQNGHQQCYNWCRVGGHHDYWQSRSSCHSSPIVIVFWSIAFEHNYHNCDSS